MRRISKRLDKAFDTRPNIYKFLVDREVDQDIANDTQEFIDSVWMDSVYKYNEMIEQLLSEAEEDFKKIDISKQVDRFCKKWLD